MKIEVNKKYKFMIPALNYSGLTNCVYASEPPPAFLFSECDKEIRKYLLDEKYLNVEYEYDIYLTAKVKHITIENVDHNIIVYNKSIEIIETIEKIDRTKFYNPRLFER